MPIGILLAMQAAGMVVDYIGTKNQQKMSEMGNKVTQAGLNANLEMTRLEAEDATLQSLKRLRQTIGTQIATFAARGTSTSAGSALSYFFESQNNFLQDERMRRMNLLSQTNQIKGSSAMARLESMTGKNKLWQSFFTRNVNTISTNSDVWSKGYQSMVSSFGKAKIGAG